MTKKKLEYGIRTSEDFFEKDALIKQLEELEKLLPPMFVVSGFAHPSLPVVTCQAPDRVQLATWGLIPHWAKDAKSAAEISNKTLNARCETVFEKPAYRKAAASQRCAVIVDGFYEHHHKGGKTYPFFVQQADAMPMVLAGIYDRWTDPVDQQERQTVSIVTTAGNELMGRIHNNPRMKGPRMKGPRMPVVLPKGRALEWLQEEVQFDDVATLFDPDENTPLIAHSVPRIRGKNSIGNRAEASMKVRYKELHDFG